MNSSAAGFPQCAGKVHIDRARSEVMLSRLKHVRMIGMVRIRSRISRGLLTAALAGAVCFQGHAQTITLPGYFVELVVGGLTFPTQHCFVGPGEILVGEKNSGIVKRIVNGAIVGNALDLAVANNSERGLLGIVAHPNVSTNGYVYIFYSKADVDGGTWIDNRVERFTYNGQTLAFDSLIFSIPFDASQQNGPYHDGGMLAFGPDGKLYVTSGDLNRGRFGNPRIEQNTGSSSSAGTGAIYRLNDDGSVPADNPFAWHGDPRVQKICVYGVRNSYGIAFDSITSRLWFTENGPDKFDEINLATLGMNSGWLKIMGPDDREATYAENNFTAYDAEDLIMLQGAVYRDPKFSYYHPNGITDLAFANSIKYDPTVRGNLFVGDVNSSWLYYFVMNQSRDEFVLSGALADKVADDLNERALTAVGSDWGMIVDIGMGPDGYLYTVSFSSGKIHRIRPALDETAPTTIMLVRGNFVSGSLPDVHFSDDLRYVGSRGITFSTQDPPLQIQFEANAVTATTNELQFHLEASVSSVNLQQTIELFNWSTGLYETVDVRNATVSDATVDIAVTANASRFIRAGDALMRAKVSFKAVGPVSVGQWQARIDRATWHVRVQ